MISYRTTSSKQVTSWYPTISYGEIHVHTYVQQIAVLVLGSLSLTSIANASSTVAPAPNGITLPADYRDWPLLAPTYRTDKHWVRAVLANDVAIKAARAGQTVPWPDGSKLVKLAWKEAPHERWPTALEAGQFVQVEIMVKDSTRYAATGGWGYARWVGGDLKPYGKNPDFAQECHGCHMPMQDHDFVFTRLMQLP